MTATNIKKADQNSPARYGAAVTPSDDTDGTGDLAQVANALYVGVSGDVNVIDGAGNDLLFKNAVGVLPISCRRVGAATTTATNIIALYF